MKKLSTLAVVAMALFSIQAHCQTPFSTIEYVDINNIKASALVHGDMFWNPGLASAQCFYPATAPTNINFTSALWMSGYDAGGKLHVAAQTYRQDGNDYWPGPLDSSDTLTITTSAKWAKIWKVNGSDISTFLGLSTHTTTNTPPVILTWPGKGNVNAAGSGGAALTITTDMAPFVDLNHNGIYEPLLGEYPDIRGDQALWWTFSDNGPTHNESNGAPLGVEVHAMAYAYKRGTTIDNVIYYDYKISNKSANNYTNFRMGLFDDVDLGYFLDDFIGFDSSHRMGIAYNAVADDGAAAGHPANSFGTNVPMVGVSMVILPGDNLTTHTLLPAGSFMYYNNDGSSYGNPTIDTEYNYLLRSHFRLGAPLVNDFAGAGVPSMGYGTGPATNYVYTGDPKVSTEWSECISGNSPGDRRFIITSNDFTMNSGSTQEVVMALMVTPTGPNNACPVAGFTPIKNIADTAWNVFYNPLPPTLGTENTAVQDGNIKIYPNPAHDHLFIDADATQIPATIAVYNVLGQKADVTVNNTATGNSIDISSLIPGLYSIIYTNGATHITNKFVKE